MNSISPERYFKEVRELLAEKAGDAGDPCVVASCHIASAVTMIGCIALYQRDSRVGSARFREAAIEDLRTAIDVLKSMDFA